MHYSRDFFSYTGPPRFFRKFIANFYNLAVTIPHFHGSLSLSRKCQRMTAINPAEETKQTYNIYLHAEVINETAVALLLLSLSFFLRASIGMQFSRQSSIVK